MAVLDGWRGAMRTERARLQLTQAQVAERAGISAETLRKYESGARNPTREHLVAILRALQLPQVRAREILAAAGFAADERLFPVADYPSYFYSLAEAATEIERTPWPQFVVGNLMEIAAANRAAALLWGVDLAAELGTRSRPQLHFLSLMVEPAFASRIVNFDDCLAMAISIIKGVPAGEASLEDPGPWADQVLAQFAQNAPSVIPKLLRLWESAPPQPPKSRWTYPLVWREPEGVIRFTGVVSTASEPDGLAFNDWMPSDAASHAVLERVLEARSQRKQLQRVAGTPAAAPARKEL